jgi:asparaginyl-tRNA synthetase
VQKVKIKTLLATGVAESKITVCGWVRTKRVSKAVAFLAINDGSTQGVLQLIVDAQSAVFDKLNNISTGAALKVTGTLKVSPGKGQSFEVHVDELDILGESPQDYPLQKKGHSMEFLREIGHLRPRTNSFGAVFRLRNVLANETHKFFQNKGFIWAHTPIISASDCEGAGEMFTVTNFDMENMPRDEKGKIDYKQDFFGKQARLSVSGQLQAEFMAMSMGDVYTFGPTFRAENSNTSRHLAEFWMVEPEMAFADLDDDQDLAEAYLKHMCAEAVKQCPDELDFFHKMMKSISPEEIQAIAESTFTRITYTEAVDILLKTDKKFEFKVEWGSDLQSEHERFLAEEVFKGPVIVTNYPKGIKSFYMRQNDDGKTVAAMDVLCPKIGEIIGGSQREERLDMLTSFMKEKGVEEEGLEWFTDLRRFGTAPHCGFGLGFERLVQYLSGMGNIRDTIPCPRAAQLIDF